MEYLINGLLEKWNDGKLECWNDGIMGSWGLQVSGLTTLRSVDLATPIFDFASLQFRFQVSGQRISVTDREPMTFNELQMTLLQMTLLQMTFFTNDSMTQ